MAVRGMCSSGLQARVTAPRRAAAKTCEWTNDGRRRRTACALPGDVRAMQAVRETRRGTGGNDRGAYRSEAACNEADGFADVDEVRRTDVGRLRVES
eukprot:scaffold867_cov317-Pavlova_lutheri.AAC.55